MIIFLKLEITQLKPKFCERAQALIHSNLHTGSVTVAPESTEVIDPEFAFYAPTGFDIGAFYGNLNLAYCAQDGNADEGNNHQVHKVTAFLSVFIEIEEEKIFPHKGRGNFVKTWTIWLWIPAMTMHAFKQGWVFLRNIESDPNVSFGFYSIQIELF